MSTNEMPKYEWRDFSRLNFATKQAFLLELDDGSELKVSSILRLMPGKRVVVLGKWQGQDVVAKIFFDSQKAMRHAEKEKKGYAVLTQRKILTPELLQHAVTDDRRVHVLFYEYIDQSENLEAVWQKQQQESEIISLLKSIIYELAAQHVLGLQQHDLHMGNFLLKNGKIFTLDAAQITAGDFLLSREQSMANLALFLSQLGPRFHNLQHVLFEYYAWVRGWIVQQKDFAELDRLIKKNYQDRWQNFSKKIFRNSTQFKKTSSLTRFVMQRRAVEGDALKQLIDNPEAFFSEQANFLKKGRSSTVIQIELDQKQYVIKRYNLKNLWHRLRRCFRPTRAAHGWRTAMKLELFGVKTAKPVAFIENRFLGLRGTSYLLMECVPGIGLTDYLEQNNEARDLIIEKVVAMLKSWSSLELTHGDLKASNILIDADLEPVLIDLDGSQEHVSLASLEHGWQKEIKRLLANFDDPAILATFKQYLTGLVINK